MDPIEVTFQDGENGNILRVKVPMMPVQLWHVFGRSYYDHATQATEAVLRAISRPPIITYNPGAYPEPIPGTWRYQSTPEYDGEGDDTTESNES